jgi:serine protease Do
MHAKTCDRLLIICLSTILFFPGLVSGAERHSAVVEVVAKAGPAVVNIRTEEIVKSGGGQPFGFSDPFFEEFFQSLVPPQTYTTQSLGSGVIIDAQGHILTNAHVVEKASKIFVALADSREEMEAVLVGKANFIDLAVIKIPSDKQLPFLTPGSSGDLMLGETVVAIGNPLGLGHSITTGIISAIQRRVPVQDKLFSVFIQTDALINPGNSGGPLINIKGELIGINTAIATQAQGIGFAIPIDFVNRVLPDLLNRGSLRKVYHGIVPALVGKDFVAASAGGVLVKGVDRNSPAAAADIRYGDVVISLDGIQVASPAEMQAMLNTYVPGNDIKLKVWRGFNALEKVLVLAEFPERYGLSYARSVFGLIVGNRQQSLGVLDVVPDSPAARAGIKAGDLIYDVGGHSTGDAKLFSTVVEAHIGFEPLRFTIVRGGRGYLVDLP